LFLTVNGKVEVVIQDAQAYRELLDRIEQLETIAGIRQRLEEFDRGEGVALDEAFK
jgi:PHD/YefM family antitoxin component YafN of YafNO toxin-antitoxin module